MSKLTKVKNRENEDILFLVVGKPSRFVEGIEYVMVQRHETDKQTHYMKKQSLVMHWKD